MKLPRLTTTCCSALFAACVFGGASLTPAGAAEPTQSAAATADQEAKLIAALKNATFTGRWYALKDGQLGPEKQDSYTIVGLTKLSGDQWQINARFRYSGQDVDLPIPAQVKWAGDTPVLILDNVTMGANRTYSARVMIYEKTYSGWWSAADHAGLISGVLTNAN